MQFPLWDFLISPEVGMVVLAGRLEEGCSQIGGIPCPLHESPWTMGIAVVLRVVVGHRSSNLKQSLSLLRATKSVLLLVLLNLACACACALT